MFKSLVATILVSALAGGATSAMTVAAFLEKADALEARGTLAIFSSDKKLLQREAQASFEDWLRQARPPVACVPKGQQFRGDPNAFLAMLRAVPPAERSRISVRAAFRREWNSRWPCR